MNRMPPAVEMDVVVEPSGPRPRQPRRHPILKCRRKPSAAGSRRSIGSASSSRRTRASGLASWGRCCAEKACIARTWRTGDGSASRAPCGTCGDVGAARPHVRSTRV